MIALQRHVQSLEEQLLRKDAATSARGSCDGHPLYTPGGVEEHVESIVTPPTGKHINIYFHLSNILTLSNLLII